MRSKNHVQKNKKIISEGSRNDQKQNQNGRKALSVFCCVLPSMILCKSIAN